MCLRSRGDGDGRRSGAAFCTRSDARDRRLGASDGAVAACRGQTQIVVSGAASSGRSADSDGGVVGPLDGVVAAGALPETRVAE